MLSLLQETILDEHSHSDESAQCRNWTISFLLFTVVVTISSISCCCCCCCSSNCWKSRPVGGRMCRSSTVRPAQVVTTVVRSSRNMRRIHLVFSNIYKDEQNTVECRMRRVGERETWEREIEKERRVARLDSCWLNKNKEKWTRMASKRAHLRTPLRRSLRVLFCGRRNINDDAMGNFRQRYDSSHLAGDDAAKKRGASSAVDSTPSWRRWSTGDW